MWSQTYELTFQRELIPKNGNPMNNQTKPSNNMKSAVKYESIAQR